MLYDELSYRGFFQQITHEQEIRSALDSGKLTFYAGFDPTASSLHVGSLVPIMALAHLQKRQHFPIVIIGGGTAMIGDPSGKTELRQIMGQDSIAANGLRIKAQIENYVTLDGEAGLALDNADWLLSLNYLEFLREVGIHFRVNEMIKAEGYRQRLERETGLSFVEFNYQLLQAYDFLVLNRKYGCALQIGGDDQWGNILAGIDLVRRVERKTVFGFTFPLITTSTGEKMGKTARGAIWLDPEKTSPYDFYQYWINTGDADAIRFLKYFTFLGKEEIEELAKLEGADIRQAKRRLAFEATCLCHGEDEARKAESAAKALFGARNLADGNIPGSKISQSEVDKGIKLTDLLASCGLAKNKSDARRVIEQGGCSLNDEKIKDVNFVVTGEHVVDGSILLRRGKKQYHRIDVK